MRSHRSAWLVVLALVVLGLLAQELLSFRAIYLGESRGEVVLTAVLWGSWVALPYLVVIALMIFGRHFRPARRLAMLAGSVVVVVGVLFASAAVAGRAGDPLIGLLWMFAPLAQLGVGIGFGIAALAAVRRDQAHQRGRSGPPVRRSEGESSV